MRDIWGSVRRTGGSEDDDGCAPSGRGRRPSFQDDGRSLLRERISPPSSLKKLSIWIGQHGMGAMTRGGRCWSGMLLSESV